jgi:hypothetical protein
MRNRPLLSCKAIIGTAVGGLLAASPGKVYRPQIPPGYVSKVVLHVDYGNAPDRIGVEWGHTVGDAEEDGEYVEPASASSMRVIGDRFYFIDATVNRIKEFRSPGAFVWESEPFFNAACLAVAPDGRVYIIWGGRLDRLSCLDGAGRLVWTKASRQGVLPTRGFDSLGMRSVSSTLLWLDWTRYGLTITVEGEDRGGKVRRLAVVVNDDGAGERVLPGLLVGLDGTIYDFHLFNKRAEGLVSPIVGKSPSGNMLRTARCLTVRFGRRPTMTSNTSAWDLSATRLAGTGCGFARLSCSSHLAAIRSGSR